MRNQTFLHSIFGRFDSGSHAAFFGKWMWIYFWMNFAGVIPAGLMELEAVSPGMSALGGVLNTLFALFSSVLLLIMGLREERLAKCGMIYFVCAVIGYGVSVLNLNNVTGLWSTVGAVLELVAEYNFFRGCANILADFDPELSGKWRKFWKWYVVIRVLAIPGTLASMVLTTTEMALIGALSGIILGMGLLVVLVMAIIYEYKTAQTFRKIAKLQKY